MPFLRILLVIAVLVEAAWLAWRVPWIAEAEFNEIPLAAKLEPSPIFKPPGPPELKVFGNRLSPFLDPKSVEITVRVDRVAFFQKFAAAVVGTFLAYGIAGYFFTKSPRPADVAYSLALTAGYVVGSVASAIAAQFAPDNGPLPWLNLFWAAGVGIAFVATAVSRRRIANTA